MSVNPSKDRPRCFKSNKRQFKTEAAAHTSMHATVRANKRHDISTCLHVYKCPDCKLYHVGHTAPSKGKRAKVAKHSPKPVARQVNDRVAEGIAHVINNWQRIERKRAKDQRKAEMNTRMKAMRIAA